MVNLDFGFHCEQKSPRTSSLELLVFRMPEWRSASKVMSLSKTMLRSWMLLYDRCSTIEPKTLHTAFLRYDWAIQYDFLCMWQGAAKGATYFKEPRAVVGFKCDVFIKVDAQFLYYYVECLAGPLSGRLSLLVLVDSGWSWESNLPSFSEDGCA